MGGLSDYQEVPCPACGHLNRRFGSAILDGRYRSSCDCCGRELATGRFSVTGFVNWAMLRVVSWFFCSLIAVGAGLILFHILGRLLLGPRYLAIIGDWPWYGVYLVGIAGGIGFAERNFRRGGLAGPKRVVPDSRPVRDAFGAKTGREWCLGMGYAGGALIGIAAAWVNNALGGPLPLGEEGLVGLGVVIGAIAGWVLGRLRYRTTR